MPPLIGVSLLLAVPMMEEEMKRLALLILALLILALMVPAGAPAAEPAKTACIDTRRINGWVADGDHALIVRVAVKQRYRLELGLGADMLDVETRNQLAFIPRDGGELCAGWGWVGIAGTRIHIRSIIRLPDTAPTPEK